MKQTKLFKQNVAIQAVLYILQQMGGVCDIHKCHKILYFADNEHLSKYGRSITGDSYIKWILVLCRHVYMICLRQ